MQESPNKISKPKEDPDRVRWSPVPSIPDFVGYLVMFLFLWSIYTIASKGLLYLEGIKEEKVKTIAEDRAEKKKAITALAHTVTGGVFRKASEVSADGEVSEEGVLDRARDGLADSLERMQTKRESRGDKDLGKGLDNLIQSVKDTFSQSDKDKKKNGTNRF